jgi:OOP family OmpA-OmpF porin
MASTNDGANQLIRMLNSGKDDGSAVNYVTSLFGTATRTQSALTEGRVALDSLFGGQLGDVSELIARFAGIRSQSVSSLLALVAPFVLRLLREQRASNVPGSAAPASLLGKQRRFLTASVPAGIGATLGWSQLTSPATDRGPIVDAAPLTRKVAQAPHSAHPWSRQVRSIIFCALSLGALIWLIRPTAPTTPARQAAQKIRELQLPGGVSRFASWLADTTDTRIPKRFVFEDLHFQPGSTEMTPASHATVSSLASILRAHPSVSVALEGYTDNTGDPTANKKLSLDRALAVKQLMIKAGIAASRIIPAGYGHQNPIAPNDTEQGRAQNRRLELVVVRR